MALYTVTAFHSVDVDTESAESEES